MPLRIVSDDQCLAALDVFFVVSHLQPVSDLLILSFFGFGRMNIHGNVLDGIVQQTIIRANLRRFAPFGGAPCWRDPEDDLLCIRAAHVQHMGVAQTSSWHNPDGTASRSLHRSRF